MAFGSVFNKINFAFSDTIFFIYRIFLKIKNMLKY